MEKNLKLEKRRLTILICVFTLMFFIIVSRLITLTIIENIKTESNEKTPSLYERGEILDSYYKKFAVSLKVYSLFCRPLEIHDMEENSVDKISLYLNKSKKKLKEIFSSQKNFVWLKRQIDYVTLKKVLNLNIKGIYYLREYKRFYPNGRLLSHVLGITGVDNIGLEGLELYYDKYLNTGMNVKKIRKKLNLVLSIDKNVQYVVEMS